METTEHTIQARDWPKDFSHENGNYQCRCGTCGQMFVGHKRRVTCKVCATPLPESVAGLVREACTDGELYAENYQLGMLDCTQVQDALSRCAARGLQLADTVESLNRERAVAEGDAEGALRSLASWLGNGGYNAPTVEAAEFERKIRDGVETMIRVETKRAEQRIERRFLAEPRISDSEMMSLLRRVNKEFELEVRELSRERAVLAEGFRAQRRQNSKGDFAVLDDADEPDILAVTAALLLIEGEKGEGE